MLYAPLLLMGSGGLARGAAVCGTGFCTVVAGTVCPASELCDPRGCRAGSSARW
jgi:hypothetical protein